MDHLRTVLTAIFRWRGRGPIAFPIVRAVDPTVTATARIVWIDDRCAVLMLNQYRSYVGSQATYRVVQEKVAEDVVIDRIVPLAEVVDATAVGLICVSDRVAAAVDDRGRADDVVIGPERVPELDKDGLEALETGVVVVDPAVVLHASLTTEKSPKRVTPQLDCDFCCAMTCWAISWMAAVLIAPGIMISGVARTPPEETVDEVPELVEDDIDELVGLETAELVGAEPVVTDAEVMLSRDWLFDWAEAD